MSTAKEAIKTNHLDGDATVGRNLAIGGDLTVQGKSLHKGNLTVKGWLEADNIKAANKGVFLTVENLESSYPTPQNGWWAVVGDTLPGPVYVANGGKWVATGKTGGNPSVDFEMFSAQLSDIESSIDTLQDDIDGNTEAINDEKTRAEAAEKANADAIVAEKNRAEAAEKTNADGIGIIRGDSHLTPSGTDSTYTLTMIIGRGTPVKVELPVHGIEGWDVPADTPALIDPWTFQELMGLFDTIENESKARSDADESLNASVKSLLQHVAKLTMAITPSVVFRSSVDTTEIAVSASMTVVTPDRLELLQGTDELAAVENTSSASSAATITPTNNVQFSAKAVVGELEFETKATLQVVDPVYAGAGAAYADIMLDEHKQTVRTSAVGIYNVTVANDGDYVWLLVPRGFSPIKKATLSGFDFPLETPTVVYVGGTSALTGGIPYSCYRSSNQYAAGNLSIVIS